MRTVPEVLEQQAEEPWLGSSVLGIQRRAATVISASQNYGSWVWCLETIILQC